MLLLGETASLVGPDWSPDGRHLMYSTWGAAERGLWVLPLTGDRKPFPFLDTPFSENAGVFSPDGRWVAYESDESGRNNVYVRPFPSGNEQYRISRDGGRAPRRRGDGRELFFLTLDGMLMSAAIQRTKAFRAEVPQALFQTGLAGNIDHTHPYAVSADGQRFLMPAEIPPPGQAPLTVLWNWPSIFRRARQKAPTAS